MDIMNQFPNMIVEVGAHTDGKGTEAYNVALSQRRADAVMNYYIYEKKVNKKRLVAKAYGTSQPVASNTTPDGKDNPDGRAMNRRTEFKLIGELKADDKKTDKKENEEVKTIVKPTPSKVIKKDVAPKPAPATKPAPKSSATPGKKSDATAPVTSQGGYKTAPTDPLVITGQVYMDKAGKRSLVSQAAVFLSSDEGGFQQKVFYVKADGTYSFDLSRAAADTFRMIARKYQYESDEVIFTKSDVKGTNKPMDLIIKMK
jgi:hypothetical protein